MRKKIIGLGVLLAVMFAVPVFVSFVSGEAVQTAARNAKKASVAQGINQVVGIAELRGGHSLEINNNGAALVFEDQKTYSTVSAVDTLVYTGEARLHTITVAGDASSAGDKVDIYDNTSATGTPVIEVSIGTAKETKHIVIPGGLKFSTGIYADVSAGTLLVTIGYDS